MSLLNEWKTHSSRVRSTTSREKTEKEYAFLLFLFGWLAGFSQESSAQSWYLHAWSGGGSKEMVWMRRDEKEPGETFETKKRKRSMRSDQKCEGTAFNKPSSYANSCVN